jgi:hypothetical protein
MSNQLPSMVDESRRLQRVAPPRHQEILTPSNLADAVQLAQLMSTAKLVPLPLQQSPADCLLVIEQAMRWQMSPFAVAQECSVISHKLMFSGKLVAAVVNARGNLAARLSYEYSGAGDDRLIIVSGVLQGETQARTAEVLLKNAKTGAVVWRTQPDQQLMYHGARVWARRHTPELMLGVYSPEEFDEKPPADTKYWPTGTVIEPGDYDGGTRERDTKKDEPKKFSRGDTKPDWDKKFAEFKRIIESFTLETDLRMWEAEHRPEISVFPANLKSELWAARTLQLQLIQSAGEIVVHDGDDPRPATAEEIADLQDTAST